MGHPRFHIAQHLGVRTESLWGPGTLACLFGVFCEAVVGITFGVIFVMEKVKGL